MSDSVKVLFKNEGHLGASAQLLVEGSNKASIHWEGGETEPRISGEEFFINNKMFVATFFDFLVHAKGLQLAAAEDYIPAWEETPDEVTTNFEDDLATAEKTYEEKMKNLRKDAKGSEKTLTKLAVLLNFGSANNPVRKGWCSACVTHSHRQELNTPRTWGDAFICTECNVVTIDCTIPGCKNFAVRGLGRTGQRNKALPQCAEHTHEIPDFETVTARIDDLSHWSTIFEYKKVEAAHAVRKGFAIASVAGVTLPLAFVAAPGIGGLIGVAKGLQGVAAVNHGLALMGGGSLAAGGMGMAGGQLVITALGTGLGGATGMRVASSYLSKDKSFNIESIRGGEGPAVVFSSGFTTEEDQSWVRWRKVIDTLYPNNPVYRVRWGSKELKDLGIFAGGRGATGAAIQGAAHLATRALKRAPRQLTPLGAVNVAAGVISNPWHTAVNRSKQAGAALASILMRTNNEDGFILIGHSLGAAMMATAAASLTFDQKESPIVDLHLMGAAYPADADPEELTAAINGKIYNYYSQNDEVLRKLFTTASFGKKAAGFKGFTTQNEKIVNVDVSMEVPGHRKYIDFVKLYKTEN